MPELPEVETIARGLKPRIIGRKISSLIVLEPKTIMFDEAIITEVIAEQKISSVWRRGKALLWDLNNGYTLMFHLKMTGQIIIDEPETMRFAGGHPTDSMSLKTQLPDKSTRAIFIFDHGAKLFFNDQRKFGWIKLLPTNDVTSDDFIQKLGPETDDAAFSPDYLSAQLSRRSTSVKAVLLDQTVIAGIGNIYADEALHMAGIHPAQPANSLSKRQVSRLYEAIKAALSAGIERGGTSFTNYVNVLGTRGDYLEHSRVFRREGQPCRVCGREIIKIRVAGRGTHLCPGCQKLVLGRQHD